MDATALAFTGLFVGWLFFGWGGEGLAPAIDFAFFMPLGLAVGLLQLRVAREIGDPRDRMAWHLLAGASFARFVSGNVWSAMLLFRPGADHPWWVVVLAGVFIVLGNLALLTFRSAALRRVDRVRVLLDALIVLAGSVLLVWYFAIVPYLQGIEGTESRDWFYTSGDALAVVLSAVLYLRSNSRLTRAVALYLCAAYVVQLVPDVIVTGPTLSAYRAGSPLEAVWYAVWVLKWMAARRALTLLATHRRAVTSPPSRYESGVLPYVFVASAPALLIYQLVTESKADTRLFLFGSGTLAALLVLRQFIELRERDRLHGEQLAEASWFRAVLAHAYDFLALVDADGQVTYASPATSRLLSTSAGDLPSKEIADALHPDDAERLRELLGRRPFATTVLSLRLRAGDGTWHDLSCRLQDLRAEPLVGAVVINGHDVTREGQLVRRLREAEEVEALGVFAGGLAHDLNNFLAVVGSHVDLLRSELPPARPQAMADLLAIHSATKRATALTAGLLTLSRRKSESRETVNMSRLVSDRLLQLDVDVDYTPPDEAATVVADPVALRYAIDALFNEQIAARRLDGRGSAVLSLETLAPDVAARFELASGRYVVLRMGAKAADDASGELELPRASQDWESAPDDLGMLLVHAAVRELGGALAIDPSVARTSIAMYLPSAAA